MRKPAALTRALAREAAELFVGEERPPTSVLPHLKDSYV